MSDETAPATPGNAEVKIRVDGAESGSVLVVPESSMVQCGACGDDLYVHEWVAFDAGGVEIYACDRA